ncbi:MAG: amidohydrolase family protein, partial [Planctomycetota bacterium]
KNDSEVKDLGDVAIIPALVNAHTRLELGSVSEPLGNGGSFTDWTQGVRAHREERDKTQGDLAASAVSQGVAESHAHAISLIGDIDAGVDWPEIETDVTGVRYLELTGLTDESIENAKERASTFLRSSYDVVKWHRGLSPHATYTAHRDLIRWIAEKSKRDGIPLAMHIAETQEELQFLKDQSGLIRELLESRGDWNPAAFEAGLRPLDYLDLLAGARRVSVIHGNYLTADELSFMGIHGNWMTLVYCPRTHAYFGHKDYPLEQALELGVQVALGTDSRASNPDLSIWREMKFVAENYASISPQTIMEMGTVRASTALGFPDGMSVGNPARLAVVELSDSGKSDCPYEWIMGSGNEPKLL